MPLDPSIYSQIDTRAPERLSEIFNPIRRDEQRNSLADLANQREIRSQQVQQGRQEMAAYPAQQEAAKRKALFDQQTQIGGVLTKLQQSIAMGNVSDDAIRQQAMQAKQYGIPDAVIQQTFGSYLQTPAEQRASMAQGHVTDYNKWFETNNPKPVFSEAGGGFVTPPNAQNPTGKVVVPTGFTPKQNVRDFNQPFMPDGSPNKAYQDYQRSLKPTDLSGKPPSGYRYTKTGDLQAIPGGPADIKEQQKSSVQETGRENVSTVVAQLRDAYGQLKEGGGITDPTAGAMRNVGAGVASSGLGQATGRMFGTQNQSKRNEILMTRPALLQHIMKATGMSAKQMDSNAELKLWLATATDPTLDIAANMNALDNIEKTYGIGGRAAPNGAHGGYDQDKEARYQAWKAQQGAR